MTAEEKGKGLNKIRGLDKLCLGELPPGIPMVEQQIAVTKFQRALKELTQLWAYCVDEESQLPSLVQAQLKKTTAALDVWYAASR